MNAKTETKVVKVTLKLEREKWRLKVLTFSEGHPCPMLAFHHKYDSLEKAIEGFEEWSGERSPRSKVQGPKSDDTHGAALPAMSAEEHNKFPNGRWG